MASNLLDNMFASTNPVAAKLGLNSKQRRIRIMVVGQRGVGKTALVVRFITRRFIGEYDSNMDRKYTHSTLVDNELVFFEIIDSPGIRNQEGVQETDLAALEKNIHIADAFILVYSVTDKCSFDDCNRLKFLINYNKRRHKSIGKDAPDIPVVLVGNKIDEVEYRMVTPKEGYARYQEIDCTGFHEISVRENFQQVLEVFRDTWHCWCLFVKNPKLKRSSSDAHTLSQTSARSIAALEGWIQEKRQSCNVFTASTATNEANTSKNVQQLQVNTEPFRARASTEGKLLSRPRKLPRRMSISQRGCSTGS